MGTKADVITFVKGMLEVRIFPDRDKMGQDAAKDVSAAIQALQKTKEEINMIFAAAPSQSDFMKALIRDKAIQWNKVNAFHMDENIGWRRMPPRGLATS